MKLVEKLSINENNVNYSELIDYFESDFLFVNGVSGRVCYRLAHRLSGTANMKFSICRNLCNIRRDFLTWLME